MRTEFDAVVVGAGPAGSSAAILLSRAGWSVALIEKAGFSAPQGLRRMHRREQPAAARGARHRYRVRRAVAGPALRSVALMRGNRSIEADLPAAAHEKHPWGRALGRETLDTLLLEQARSTGAEVLQPWSVQALEGAPGDWRCGIRSWNRGDPRSCAPGSPSTRMAPGKPCRPLAGTGIDGRTALRTSLAFKANFRGRIARTGLLPVLSLDGGYGGMVVADGGVTTVACCVRRDRLDACRLGISGECVPATSLRHFSGASAAVCATRCRRRPAMGPWLAAGPLHPGIRVDARDGSFRIGNAAGEAHPIIGEGMSMAMQVGVAALHSPARRRTDRERVGDCAATRRRPPLCGAAGVVTSGRDCGLPRLSRTRRCVRLRRVAGRAGPRLAGTPDARRAIRRQGTERGPASIHRVIPTTGEHDMNTTLDRLRVLLVKDYKLEPDLLTPDAPLESAGHRFARRCGTDVQHRGRVRGHDSRGSGGARDRRRRGRYIDDLVATQTPPDAIRAGVAADACRRHDASRRHRHRRRSRRSATARPRPLRMREPAAPASTVSTLRSPSGSPAHWRPAHDSTAPIISNRRQAAHARSRQPVRAVCGEQAVGEAQSTSPERDRGRAGVFVGTGMGGSMRSDDGYKTLYGDRSDRIKPFTVLMGMHNAPAAWIGIEHDLRGPNLTFSTACSSSAVAIGEALAAHRGR